MLMPCQDQCDRRNSSAIQKRFCIKLSGKAKVTLLQPVKTLTASCAHMALCVTHPNSLGASSAWLCAVGTDTAMATDGSTGGASNRALASDTLVAQSLCCMARALSR